MIKCCIFDLDGTVLNTIDTIRYYLNKTLVSYGLHEVSLDDTKRFVGNGARVLIERALGAQGKMEIGVDRVLTDYLAAYDAEPYLGTYVFSGVPELLDELKKKGIVLVLLSNKPHSATLPVANSFFPDVFDVVAGAREGVPLKPDPTSANEILDELGISAKHVAFIGDSDVDVYTAKNIGTSLAIGVCWGFRSTEELHAAGADVVVNAPREILDEVMGHA